jgi:hypothetical protein
MTNGDIMKRLLFWAAVAAGFGVHAALRMAFGAPVPAAPPPSGISIVARRPSIARCPNAIQCDPIYEIRIPRPLNPLVVAVRYSITANTASSLTGVAYASGIIEVPALAAGAKIVALSALFSLGGESERFTVATAELTPTAEAIVVVELE